MNPDLVIESATTAPLLGGVGISPPLRAVQPPIAALEAEVIVRTQAIASSLEDQAARPAVVVVEEDDRVVSGEHIRVGLHGGTLS